VTCPLFVILFVLSLCLFLCLNRPARHLFGPNHYSGRTIVRNLKVIVRDIGEILIRDLFSIHSGITVLVVQKLWLELSEKHLPAAFPVLPASSFVALLILRKSIK